MPNVRGEGSIEVKADKMWSKTKNLCFEYREYDMQLDGDQRTGLMSTRQIGGVMYLLILRMINLSSGVRIWETK